MRTIVGSSAALLLGFGILEVGDGLQSTLLGLRASMEGFATPVTGVVMSLFYVGFLGGCLYVERLVRRVGHVRVFGALASIASATALAHAVFVDPVTWGVLRLASGFCFAGLYVVAESWLNARADNETRGKLLSIYMVVTYLGIGGGQLLLNVGSPATYDLFVLTSVLISMALVPLLLSAGPVPSFEATTRVTVRQLVRYSPLGTFGAFATGMAGGALFGIGPIYANEVGLSVRDTSWFMAAAVAGVVVLQWPIGHLSDRFDRRLVLFAVAVLTSLVAAWPAAIDTPSIGVLLVAVAALGGLALPLYSLSIAHANDYLESDEIVAASAGLVLVNGVGAVLGPVSASAAMEWLGPGAFFGSLSAVHAAIAVFALIRMWRRPSRPLTAQGRFAFAALGASQVAVEWIQQAVRTARARRTGETD